MSNTISAEIVCRRCRARIDATDNYCRVCGEPTSDFAPHKPKRSDNPWLILVLLFCVLGPFAFPLLWRSRAFSPLWKIILTIVVTGLTIFVFWFIWHYTQKMLESLTDFNRF
jgi:hypothetical protein